MWNINANIKVGNFDKVVVEYNQYEVSHNVGYFYYTDEY